MFTIIFDFLRWCFSKILVVFVIVIATVILTLAFRYGAEQEKLLAAKFAQMKTLEQLRAEATRAMERRRLAANELKSVTDRLANPQKEKDAIKATLAKSNQQLASALNQVNKLKGDMQSITRTATAQARGLRAKHKVSLGARALLRSLQETKPNPIPHWIDYLMWRQKWDAAMAAYNQSVRIEMEASAAKHRAVAALKTAKERLANTAQRIDTLTAQSGTVNVQLQALDAKIAGMLPDTVEKTKALESAEQQEQDLRDSEKTALQMLTDVTGRVRWYENARAEVISAFQSSRTTIILLIVVVFGGPPALKVFWFFIIAGFAKSASPLRYETNESGSAIAAAEGKILEAPFSKDRNLASRPDWVKTWSPTSQRSTIYLWDWHAPTISYVAGLRELTSFTMEEAEVTSTVTLGSGDDPHMHLLRLDLADHPGFVLRPDNVVAISGNLRIRTKWNFFSLHSWVCGSFRKILFYGTGTIYIRGYGGVSAIDCTNSPRNVEDNFVIGYDSRSVFRTVRTETFWPYFRNKTSLFDYSFGGPGLTLSEIAKPPGEKASDNPLKRTLDAILNAIGKLLGF